MMEEGQQVYFMENPATGLIKIGFSGDVPKRKKALERQVGAPLTLLGSVPGARYLEQTLHQAFDDIRQFGEWFSDSGHLRKYIQVLVGVSSGEIPSTVPVARVMPKEGWVHYWTRLGKVYEQAAACLNCQTCAEHTAKLNP